MLRRHLTLLLVLSSAVLITAPALAQTNLREAGGPARFRVIDRFPDGERVPVEIPTLGESSPFYPIITEVEKGNWSTAYRKFQDEEIALPLQNDPLQRFLAGYVALQSSRHTDVLRYYDSLEEELPLFADSIHLYSAQAALRAGEPHKASLSAAAVSSDSRHYPEALYLLARALHENGEDPDLERASEVLDLYLERYPSSSDAPQARHLLAEIHLALNRPTDAALAYLHLRDHFPLHSVSSDAAEKLAALRDSLDARLQRQIDAESTERVLRRYRALFDRHNSEVVIDELATRLEDFGRGSDARCESLFLVARSHTKLRRHSDGTPYYDRLLRECPNTSWEIRALYLGGRGRWNAGDRDGAMVLFERIWTEYPDHSFSDDAMYFTARILRSEDRHEEADEMLRRQVKTYPDGDMAKDAHWLTLRQMWDRQAFSEIVEYVDSLASTGEDDLYTRGRLHYFRARALQMSGQPAEASQSFVSLMRDHPKSYYSLLAINRLARMQGATDSGGVDICATSGPVCDELLSTDRQRRPIAIPATLQQDDAFTRGTLLLSLGLTDLARAELAELRSRHGANPNVLWALASLLDRAGAYPLSHDIARRHISGWMDRYPDSETRAQWLVAYPTPFHDLITRYAKRRNLDPALIYAIMREESGFNPRVESWANARGLLQLIEDTAQTMASRDGLSPFSFDQLFDPNVNIRLGSAFLDSLGDLFDHHPALIVAGYNAGGANVSSWLKSSDPDLPLDLFVEDIPFGQTRNYTKRVLMSFWIYSYLYGEHRVPSLAFGLPN